MAQNRSSLSVSITFIAHIMYRYECSITTITLCHESALVILQKLSIHICGIIVVMGRSHYGPVVMVHMVVIMVHLGKSLWSTWVSHYGPPKKSLWSTIRNILK